MVDVNVKIRLSNGVSVTEYIRGVPEDSEIITKLLLAKSVIRKLLQEDLAKFKEYNLTDFM